MDSGISVASPVVSRSDPAGVRPPVGSRSDPIVAAVGSRSEPTVTVGSHSDPVVRMLVETSSVSSESEHMSHDECVDVPDGTQLTDDTDDTLCWIRNRSRRGWVAWRECPA